MKNSTKTTFKTSEVKVGGKFCFVNPPPEQKS